jgi:hypothetical protein
MAERPTRALTRAFVRPHNLGQLSAESELTTQAKHDFSVNILYLVNFGAATLGTYNYSGVIQKVTVTETGTYDITAFGAQGGAGYHAPGVTFGTVGGQGAEVTGDFQLTQGETLEIVVGGQGKFGYFGGGGGGGSFVLVGNSGS